MVTQAPKRTAVLAALAFTLSCVGLIIFVWTQFGGTVPFAPQGYRVGALFKETGLLVPNADVRISGVNVGKVSTVANRGLYSFVTMQLDRQYAPIPVDTRAILRQKTLLGEAYVELSTGTGSGRKLPDGGTIPRGQVATTQQLDQVLGSFDKPTQENLDAFLSGGAAALAGQAQNLNNAIGDLDPAVSELTAVVDALNDQQGSLRQVISDGGTVLSTLGSRSADLQTLITAGDQVLSATAARNTALTATVDALPPFLSQLRTTLVTLNTSLGLAGPSLAALRPVAPLLTPALADVITLSGPATSVLRRAPTLLRDATVALPAITRFTNAFHPTLDQLLPAAQQVAPVISFIGLYSRELVTAMANLGADLQATAPAATPTGKASYLRAISMLSDETPYGQTVRNPTNRNSTYFSPGALAYLVKGGLLSASCTQTHNTSQANLGFSNVPCRLQPQFKWGGGILTSYFPHLKQAPK